jgi:hypothetical protein
MALRRIRAADEVFLSTALLQRENPDREDFTIGEIVERAAREQFSGYLRPAVRAHASLHCVANLAPRRGRYLMLYATGDRTQRLLRSGDPVHPGRTGKVWPDADDVPPQYVELIEWVKQAHRRWLDGVFQLRGMGRELWQGDDPDEYVRRLREAWL